MIEPGRKFVQGVKKYRYGFGGQEKSDEIKGEGYSYTAGYWEYDSRIGRRWNVDPVVKVWESPYLCFSGNPIWFSDFDGSDTSKGVKSTIPNTIKEWYEQAKKDYEVNKITAIEINKERAKEPLINFTAAVTVGLDFTLKAKVLGVGVNATVQGITQMDLIGVRENELMVLGKNTKTGSQPRKILGAGLNIGGFGASFEAEIDKNKQTGGGLTKITKNIEVPFSTWESKTLYDPQKKKIVSTKSSHKTQLLSVKAAALIGIELEISVNSREILMAPIPINPFTLRGDNTTIPLPVIPVLLRKN